MSIDPCFVDLRFPGPSVIFSYLSSHNTITAKALTDLAFKKPIPMDLPKPTLAPVVWSTEGYVLPDLVKISLVASFFAHKPYDLSLLQQKLTACLDQDNSFF